MILIIGEKKLWFTKQDYYIDRIETYGLLIGKKIDTFWSDIVKTVKLEIKCGFAFH